MSQVITFTCFLRMKSSVFLMFFIYFCVQVDQLNVLLNETLDWILLKASQMSLCAGGEEVFAKMMLSNTEHNI